jgi:GT2 family glycosyltransferase
VSGALDLEVLVVSYNSADALAACMTSVERAIPGTPIAIREHGSDPAASELLDRLAVSHPSAVRIERDPTNPGFGAGCNALAGGSRARFLLFLNPDAEVVSWPWSVSGPPPSATIVGPLMVDSGDPARHWGRRYRIRDEIARSWLRRRGPQPDGRGFVSGAALLVDRASFERVGGFDEEYFLFYEDIDLCLRANDLGIATRVDERWTVHHVGAHSTRSQFGQSLLWSYESAVRFHGHRGGPVAAYRLYVIADALVRGAVWLVHRDRTGVGAYIRLAKRALRDMVSRRSPCLRSPQLGRASWRRATRT